ncbi:MAG: PQQ-dependent dehydrogenase, methanol/ethanol family [Novosphingobium sp.]|nr:PQQ-dependent dehydrogenase, methanol/ethanol family [Novosphingobium sp.]
MPLARMPKNWIAGAAALALAACGGSGGGVADGDDWPDYDGPTTTHYSPLDEIVDGNVDRLGLDWHFDIDVGGQSLTAPVEVDGVLYFAAGASHVHALDATTGKLLWQYDSQTREKAGVELRGAWGSRGIAYANGKVFTGTLDGRLIALDAKSGKVLWTAQTTEKNDGRYISGAPWVYKDKVVIGHGGADYAPVRGYVTAYDQDSGKQAWRFWTVPGDPARGFENKTMEMAAKTWSGEWWKYGGGATVWNAMAYDPKYNRLYIGTGNGAPWNRKIRSPEGGDNLFVCSIVALDADTGEYVWHYQTNPGETWDFNSAMDIELAELQIDGKPRDVILHAPKNGFFYVIDRKDGKLVSAKPIVPITWASGIDAKTGRAIENPAARFPDGKPVVVYPSPFGAHNIEAMSFNPGSGLVYIPAMDQGRVYLDPDGPLADWTFRDGQRISNGIGAIPPEPKPRQATSFLLAWNPLTQSEAWRIPMKGVRGGGGTATTAGNLLVQGRGDGRFVILAADTGKELWSFDAQTSVMAQPITYRAGGKQYIAVIAGSRFSTAQGIEREWDYYTQQWRVLAFALDGKDKLPPAVDKDMAIPDDPSFRVDPALAREGAVAYADRCATCHGATGLSGGSAPDLLRSGIPLDATGFVAFVRNSPVVSRGMPAFGEVPERELLSIAHYLRQRAREVAKNKPRGAPVDNHGQ